MKTAKIEKLEPGTLVLGSPTVGEWLVQEFEDGQEVGGGFFPTKELAEKHAQQWSDEDA